MEESVEGKEEEGRRGGEVGGEGGEGEGGGGGGGQEGRGGRESRVGAYSQLDGNVPACRGGCRVNRGAGLAVIKR